ncbi:MAG: MlaD family protein [Chitinophagaceae bacterium]
MKNEARFNLKVGMFAIIGILIFVVAIYFVGKQKNLFVSTLTLKTVFRKVNGLTVGNNVRFSGINIGTVDEIELINDTSVAVTLVIKKKVQRFIKSDAYVGIGSDGLMGDKVVTIYPGTTQGKMVTDQSFIESKNSIDIEDVMSRVKKSVDNVEIITYQLALFSYKMNNGNGALHKLISDEQFSTSLKNTILNLQTSSNEFAKFTYNMNNGNGTISKLMTDDKFGKTLDSTMQNLQTGSKGLSDNMEAAKHNILLRGYFNRKKKAEAKKQAALKKANRLNDLNLTDSLKQR